MTDETFEDAVGKPETGRQESGEAGENEPETERIRRKLLAEMVKKKRRYSAKVAAVEEDAAKARKEAEEAKAQIEGLERENGELKTFAESLEDENARLSGALAGYLEILEARVPEDKRALIPEGGLVEKTEWLSKAVQEGLFSGVAAAVGGPAPSAAADEAAYSALLEGARAAGDVLKVMEIKERINHVKRSL